MRRAFLVILPLILVGCGLPPAVTIASYALDGISFLSSGKTVSDHALSAVAQRDCALWRVVKDELVCREYRNGERGVLVAFAEAWEKRSPGDNSDVPDAEDGAAEFDWRDTRPVVQTAADPVLIPSTLSHLLPALDGVARVAPTLQAAATTFFSGRPLTGQTTPDGTANSAAENENDLILPVPQALQWKPVITIGSQPVVPVVSANPAAVADKPIGTTVLIVGSFRKKINARRAAGSLPSFRPVVVPVRIEENTFYRVVAGPFAAAAIKGRKGALRSEGVLDVWSARLCHPGKENPGCVSLPRGPNFGN